MSLHVRVSCPLGHVEDLQPRYSLRLEGSITGLFFALLARWRACLGDGASLLVGETGLLHRVCRPDGLLFRIADRDGVIQARDLEDALVML